MAWTPNEAGWQTIDDMNATLTYEGSWTYPGTEPNMYLGTNHYQINDTSSHCKFNFTGTKLRLISMIFADGNTDIKLSVDGNVVSYSLYSAATKYKQIVYEKTDYADTEHYVDIYVTSCVPKYIVIDAIDISDIGELKTYNPSPSPPPTTWTANQERWQTFDDTDSHITYIGTEWGEDFDSREYLESMHFSRNDTTAKIRFNFTGDKIRLISLMAYDHKDCTIVIDGISYPFTQYSVDILFQKVCFELTGLVYTEHYVEIQAPSENYGSGDTWFSLDAIDIDEFGILKNYSGIAFTNTRTTVTTETLTLIQTTSPLLSVGGLDLVNLGIDKTAYFEFYENDVLFLTINISEGIDRFNVFDFLRSETYNWANMKIKTNANSCNVIVYCNVCP